MFPASAVKQALFDLCSFFTTGSSIYYKSMNRLYSIYIITPSNSSVVYVMKIWNIVPRAEIEATFLAFWASVLTIYTM